MQHTNFPAFLDEVITQFSFQGQLIHCTPFGSGHINDTFLLTYRRANRSKYKVVLQKINTTAFKKPEELMLNMMNICSHLRAKIGMAGGDPDRETLTPLYTKNGKPYYWDSTGGFWRATLYIADSISYNQVEKPEHFYESALAFGRFQSLLSDFPAHTLFETIPGFHDTAARLEVFKQAVEEDIMGRADSVREDIQFILDREDVAHCFGDLLKAGEIPLRVTHNDTKLNNVMFDINTDKAICVVDLDTVMPGLAMNDFGDSIRFGASTAAEDERNLNKVWCDLELFRQYTKGFLEGCQGKLTPKEVELLPMGAKVMTYECGMRFLTDYLQGDTYFKISRENQNLDRFRTHKKLVSDMEDKWEQMHQIVKELYEAMQ